MALRPDSPEFIALTKFPLVFLGIEDYGDQLELVLKADQRYHILVEKQEPEGISCPDELYRLLLNLERSRGVALPRRQTDSVSSYISVVES